MRLLLLLLLPLSAGATEFQVPANCQDLAQKYIIRHTGSLDSTDMGARLWAIARLRHARAEDQSQAACLDKIWNQAINDEADYWAYIAKEYGCQGHDPRESGDAPLASASPDCRADLQKDVQASLSWIGAAQGFHETWEKSDPCYANGGTPMSSAQKQAMADVTDAAAAAGGLPNAHQPPASTSGAGATLDTGVTPAEVVEAGAPAAAANSCQGVAKRDLRKDLGGIDDRRSVMPCVKGLATGIMKDIYDNVKGFWHLLEGGLKLPYTLTKGSIAVIKAITHGTTATIWREVLRSPALVLEKVENVIMSAVTAVQAQIDSYTSCYNPSARKEFACKELSYWGMNLALWIPKSPIFLPSLLYKGGKAILSAKLLRGLGESGAVVDTAAAAEGVKLAETAEKASRFRFFKDISSGLSVAYDGGRILINKAGRVFELLGGSVKDRFVNAFRRLRGAKTEVAVADVAPDAAKAAEPAHGAEAAAQTEQSAEITQFNPSQPEPKPEPQVHEQVVQESGEAPRAETLPADQSNVAPDAPVAAAAPAKASRWTRIKRFIPFTQARREWKSGVFAAAEAAGPDAKKKAMEDLVNQFVADSEKPTSNVELAEDPTILRNPTNASQAEIAAAIQATGDKAAEYLKLTRLKTLSRAERKLLEQGSVKGFYSLNLGRKTKTLALVQDERGRIFFKEMFREPHKAGLLKRVVPFLRNKGPLLYTSEIPIPPEYLTEAFPEIEKTAALHDAVSIQIGASKGELASAERFTVTFDSEKNMEAFEQALQAEAAQKQYLEHLKTAGLYEKAMYRVGQGIGVFGTLANMAVSPVRKLIGGVATGGRMAGKYLVAYPLFELMAGAIVYCGNDDYCLCQYYEKQGINPRTNKQASDSPFTCTRDGIQMEEKTPPPTASAPSPTSAPEPHAVPNSGMPQPTPGRH